MCGIIACDTTQPAIDHLLEALERLEYRGYDSVGVAVRVADGSVTRVRTTRRVDDLEDRTRLWEGPQRGVAGIGHTRWATHGQVTEQNAHPHTDCTASVSLVHNGIIANADVLRAALTAAGHVLESDVDSEVLCHLIEDERTRTADLLHAVKRALTPVEGSWALAVLEHRTGRIVVAAHKSPLLIARGKPGSFATSDIGAVANWVDDFAVLEDGDVAELNGTRRWLRRPGRSPRPEMRSCDWSAITVGHDGYADFMEKEIDEQPLAVSRLLDDIGAGIPTGGVWNGLGLRAFERVLIIGCGTSLHAGHVIGNVIAELGKLPVRCVAASEATQLVIEPNTLCVAISQSGETADVLAALEAPAAAGVQVLALTNVAHSTLARRADAVVPCAAGPEICVAATKTFVSQVVTGSAVMISALVALGNIEKTCAAALLDRLREVPGQLHVAIAAAKEAAPVIADALRTSSGVIFVSRGAGLPYAAEGALKLKELTYLWAEHYPAGELKHGPLALISEGTPVVVVDTGDPKLFANMAEIRARGGRIITVGAPDSALPVSAGGQQPWGPLVAAAPLQVLARTLALALGRDIDKPRNLAKSVTVE